MQGKTVPVPTVVSMDPFMAALLDARPARLTGAGDYHPLSVAEIEAALQRLLNAHGMSHCRPTGIRRLSGGASQEQFAFDLECERSEPVERLVLRISPMEGASETSCLREAEVVTAVSGVVPVPKVRFSDPTGEWLGAPGLVMSFIDGVTKPPDVAAGVSGLGTGLGPVWRQKLSDQFVENLAAIHSFDVRSRSFETFTVPEGPFDAALWQVNLWSRVWREDAIDGFPIVAIAEAWLRENLPRCDDPAFVHGDYRTGNYLFDPVTGKFNAILDWELSYIGDFHHDLAYNFVGIYGQRDESGRELCSSLMTREELIQRYETASGRSINHRTLAFYHILSSWSLLIMGRASCLRAAAAKHNHQDILLTWLSAVAHPLADEIARLLIAERNR